MRGVSERTVQRHWEKARIYLHDAIERCAARLSRERWRAVSPLPRPRPGPDGRRARAPGSPRCAPRTPRWPTTSRRCSSEHDALEARGLPRATRRAPPAAASLAGQALGAYTLRSPIGQGGMGSVWLAERSDGRFEGVAAVKLLNASLVGRDGEARFRREGSILARLRHPHIAHLIDAGVSPPGQPYLVLEHVDGERIDRYCDAREPRRRGARPPVPGRAGRGRPRPRQPDRAPRPQAVERAGDARTAR